MHNCRRFRVQAQILTASLSKLFRTPLGKAKVCNCRRFQPRSTCRHNTFEGYFGPPREGQCVTVVDFRPRITCGHITFEGYFGPLGKGVYNCRRCQAQEYIWTHHFRRLFRTPLGRAKVCHCCRFRAQEHIWTHHFRSLFRTPLGSAKVFNCRRFQAQEYISTQHFRKLFQTPFGKG